MTSQPQTCAKCGAPMQPHQEWCLQCGAGQPGSFGSAAGWRTGAAVLAIAALLVVGASVAGYAALTKRSPKPARPVLALRPTMPVAPTTTAPGTTPTSTAPAATPTPTPSGGSTPGLPSTTKSTPPKIPLQTPTPKASGGGEQSANSLLFPPGSSKQSKAPTTKTPTTPSTPAKSPTEVGKTNGKQTGAGAAGESGSGANGSEAGSAQPGKEAPSPILLDTNAAATYNPYAYPAAMFGDPSLAIDGEANTAWTALVDPAKAPNMAVGLVLDLKSGQKLGSAKVMSTTTGATMEMYGANGPAPPTTIADPAWKRLGGRKVLKQKATTLKLKAHGVAYRYILLWITKAPAGASRVAIDELELFPAA